MSCVEITLRRQGGPIALDVERHGNMEFNAEPVGRPIAFKAEWRGKDFLATVERAAKPLEFRCGLVCSLGSAFYLNVEPESIWLLPENGFSQDVVVYSNVTWIIE